jgi:hypothetical protein
MPIAKKMKLWKVSSLVLAVSVLVLSVFTVRAYAFPQPNMEAALSYLQQARAALDRAEHNKGGFRVKAIEHVDKAINAVQMGIDVGNRR